MKLGPGRIALSAGLLALLLMVPAASFYYDRPGESCANCHEIRNNFNTWHASSHRGVSCSACHGDILTLDVDFHLGNLRRVITHVRGQAPEQIRIRNNDVGEMLDRCRKCHQQEFADWQAGPHSATYADLFLDAKHNREELLEDDCLRCHGMHFNGGIRDLVTPVNKTGPWMLKDPKLGKQAAIPCLTCHQIHREGQPLTKSQRLIRKASTTEEITRPSLALYDRRESTGIALARLPLPAMKEGTRPVKMSTDARQGLCYQCHAPTAAFQVGSGDDRTAIGVHEGLSCMACHQKHGLKTRASCANCHPRLSNCGLNVEKMDTSFVSEKSRHNVHTVKCVDCHEKGVPRRKDQRMAGADPVRAVGN